MLMIFYIQCKIKYDLLKHTNSTFLPPEKIVKMNEKTCEKIELRAHTHNIYNYHTHTHLHTHLTDMSLEIGTDVQCHPQRL